MIYRLFISHRWRYDDYPRLVAMLNRAAPTFLWDNYSISEDRGFEPCSDRRMKGALRNQIQRVHAVVVMGGMEAHYSEWMQTELRIAIDDFEKPLVWVRPYGISRIPQFAYEIADEVVGWSGRSIVGGIIRAVRSRRPDFERFG